MLTRDEVPTDRWVLVGRVSSAPQRDNTSTTVQIENLNGEVRQTGGETVRTFELAESAGSTDKEWYDEIMTLAENDKFDVLGVNKLDRLTRANGWDAMRYLDDLRNEGRYLYAHTHGYFDWNSTYDFERLASRVAFAREWYQRIIESGRQGQKAKLEKKKWPFGDVPHGYMKTDDERIRLTEQGEEINQKIVQVYLETENMKQVSREINSIYGKNVSYEQIQNILSNPILMGDLELDGLTVAHDQDLEVIDSKTYSTIQQIRDGNSSSPSDTRKIAEPIDRATLRYGVEHIISLLPSVGTECRKCGGDIRPNGTTERWGTTLRKFACTLEDCGYEGPLINEKEYNKLHQMLPLRCPYCPFTDRYEVEERSGGFWNYKYTCKNCGHAFGSDMSPDNVKRALNNTRLIFNWNQKSDLWERERTGCETQDGSDSKDTMESEEPNSNDIDESEQTERSQVKLVDY